MQATLIIVKGQTSKDEVKVKLPTVIGRSREASLTIAHPLISRKHCELFEAEGGLLMVRDLGSLNGTYIGDDRIAEAPLPPKSRFTVGPLTFRVEYEYSGDLDALPPVKLAPSAAADEELEEADRGIDSETSDTTTFHAERPVEEALVDDKSSDEAESDDIPFAEIEEADEKSSDEEGQTVFALADEVETEPLKPVKSASKAEPDEEADSEADEEPASTPAPAKPEKKSWFSFGKKKADKKPEKEQKAAEKPAPAAKAPPAKKAAPAKPAKKAPAKKSSDDDLALEALQEAEGAEGQAKDVEEEALDDFFKSLE